MRTPVSAVGRITGCVSNRLRRSKGSTRRSGIPTRLTCCSDRRCDTNGVTASELQDMDWLLQNLGPDEDVQIRSLTNDQTILVLAGPKAQAVLQAVSRADWSNAAFPRLSVRECFVGIAPATVMAVSFFGERAYEIHVPNASLYAANTAVRDAGASHGLK